MAEKRKTLSRTLVRGSEASPLQPKSPEGFTHKYVFQSYLTYSRPRWKCFVRGPADEDISGWVEKVVFHLHPSFEESERVIEKPPYEVTEQGWGEFDIQIIVHFREHDVPTEFTHALKLHPETKRGGRSGFGNEVVSSAYEVIYFRNPSRKFVSLLQEYPQTSARPPLKGDLEFVPDAPVEQLAAEEIELNRHLDLANADVKLKLKQLLAAHKRTLAETKQVKKDISALESSEGREFNGVQFHVQK